MTNKEKIECYKQKTIKELEEIINNPNSTESDVVIATIEKHHKEEALGIAEYFTTEEVLGQIFSGVSLA